MQKRVSRPSWALSHGYCGRTPPLAIHQPRTRKVVERPHPLCYADSMIILEYFFILLLALYVWAVLNPLVARTFVAGLMRRRRRYLVQHYGQRSADRLFREFRRRALEEGADAALIEAVIHEYRPKLIERLGTQESNARLGKPRPLERYF